MLQTLCQTYPASTSQPPHNASQVEAAVQGTAESAHLHQLRHCV